MKATLTLFIVGLAVVSAWKLPNWINHQDVKEIQANEQKFIDAQKPEFKAAAAKADKATMNKLSLNLVNNVKSAKELSDKALPGILKVTKVLREKTEQLNYFWLQNELVEFITHAMDGNRGNTVYCKLDASRTWIEDRLGDIVNEDMKKKYEEARDALVEARDALDVQVQVFATSIKAIKGMTDWVAQNYQQIKAEIAKIERANIDSKFLPLTDEAIKKTQELTAL